MAKTIEHRSIDMLNRYGWKYDNTRRSPAWIDPQGRTQHAIYLGSRGSIRYGYNKTESRPINGGLDGLAKFLASVDTRPLPDNSELLAKKKANDDRKEELVKLHRALQGISPKYTVVLWHNEDMVGQVIDAQENGFTTLESCQNYITAMRHPSESLATDYTILTEVAQGTMKY